MDYTWQIQDQLGILISNGKNSVDMKVFETIPNSYALYQNFPNPFNPKTTIRYQLPVDGKVKLEIYNMLGQKVVTLVDNTQKAGYYSKDWDISNSNIYESGVYVLRVIVSGIDKSRYIKSKKIILMK